MTQSFAVMTGTYFSHTQKEARKGINIVKAEGGRNVADAAVIKLEHVLGCAGGGLVDAVFEGATAAFSKGAAEVIF